MIANPVTAINARHEENDVVEHADRSAEFVISPQFACHYDANEAVLWSRWMPRGIPSFNIDLLHDLERGSQTIEGYFSGAQQSRPLDYIVLRSAARGTFSVGGDLGYFQRLIVAQNRARLTEYARAAIDVQYRNFTAHNLPGVTTVALLEGDALGGGFECALSCDVVIAEKHVKAGFPEVLFNMFPGMGGISFLIRRVGRAVADEIVRTGRQYTAQELLELGVIDHVAETGEGVAALRDLMRRREHQKAAHDAMNTVDRLIRPLTLQELHDVAKIWVDCALKLSPRGLEWMQRLYTRQLSIFGRPLEIAGDHAEAESMSRVAAAA
jgi:DSF synthase